MDKDEHLYEAKHWNMVSMVPIILVNAQQDSNRVFHTLLHRHLLRTNTELRRLLRE